MRVKPVGVYVIERGHVRWVPAVDPVRAVLASGLTAMALLAAVRRIARARDDRAARIARAVTLARTTARARARSR